MATGCLRSAVTLEKSIRSAVVWRIRRIPPRTHSRGHKRPAPLTGVPRETFGAMRVRRRCARKCIYSTYCQIRCAITRLPTQVATRRGSGDRFPKPPVRCCPASKRKDSMNAAYITSTVAFLTVAALSAQSPPPANVFKGCVVGPDPQVAAGTTHLVTADTGKFAGIVASHER